MTVLTLSNHVGSIFSLINFLLIYSPHILSSYMGEIIIEIAIGGISEIYIDILTTLYR